MAKEFHIERTIQRLKDNGILDCSDCGHSCHEINTLVNIAEAAKKLRDAEDDHANGGGDKTWRKVEKAANDLDRQLDKVQF